MQEALTFPMEGPTGGLWLHLSATYGPADAPEPWTLHAYLITNSAPIPDKVFWSHATIENIDGNMGEHYRFIGAADVNQRGPAEIVIQLQLYEYGIYYLLERNGDTYLPIAAASGVGL